MQTLFLNTVRPVSVQLSVNFMKGISISNGACKLSVFELVMVKEGLWHLPECSDIYDAFAYLFTYCDLLLFDEFILFCVLVY